MKPLFHRAVRVAITILAVSLAAAAPFTSAVQADEPPSLLAQLNRETQALYQTVQTGIVRLQLPSPRWLNEMAAADDPLRKWGQQLNPGMREGLLRQRQQVEQGRVPRILTTVIPATQPKGGEAAIEEAPAWEFGQMTLDGTITVHSNRSNAPAAIQIRTGGRLDDNNEIDQPIGPVMSFQAVGSFAPNNVGLVMDADGHVLVPLYIEKETIGEGVAASVGNGITLKATFVASDRQSNLSVFKLPESVGKPLKTTASRPAEGSMVMLLAPNAGTAKLILWAGDKSDLMGVVVSTDGVVNGFARGNGQFLSAGICKPVVDQLVQYGQVKRGKLGMLVMQVGPSDIAREKWQSLGGRPALRIQDVTPDSAASRAGLHKGDLITSLAGEEVGNPTTLAAVLAGRNGSTPILVLRDGKPLELKIELAAE